MLMLITNKLKQKQSFGSTKFSISDITVYSIYNLDSKQTPTSHTETRNSCTPDSCVQALRKLVGARRLLEDGTAARHVFFYVVFGLGPDIFVDLQTFNTMAMLQFLRHDMMSQLVQKKKSYTCSYCQNHVQLQCTHLQMLFVNTNISSDVTFL